MTSDRLDVNRRILVIDDTRSIHDDFRKILSERPDTRSFDDVRSRLFGGEPSTPPLAGFELDAALQGREGLEKVCQAKNEQRPYALAFVDMRMPPGWDGLETIEHLWREDPDLQIVICTAHANYSWEEIIERLGRTDRFLILKKPFDTAEVRQIACAMTEKWSLACKARLKVTELEERVRERTSTLRNEISVRKTAEGLLRFQAHHDTLTGLPNRTLLMQRLSRCVERAREKPGRQFALLFLDIDNFKTINDSLGHEAGDRLIKQIADRLTACTSSFSGDAVGSVCMAARFGGDEFVVLVEGIRQAEDVVRFAGLVKEQLGPPIHIDGHDMTVTMSMGISLHEDDCTSAEDMVREADTAMYRAKQSGKAQYAIFDDAMHAEIKFSLQLENDLQKALRRREFELYFQPIVDLNSAMVCSFEALVRWNRPDHGLVSPTDFIPIAEQKGLIIPLGRWILREACRQLREWKSMLPPDRNLSINVNVSKRQLLDPEWGDEVRRVLGETGVTERELNLEITESAIMENPVKIVKSLEELRRSGISVHMDDFGTGQSSLSCLHSFPVNVLKIDRSFIATMSIHRDYAAIIHAIITLAKNMNMHVTAEGIESADQLAQLLAMDCDCGQGYLFSRPLTGEAAGELLTHQFAVRAAA